MSMSTGDVRRPSANKLTQKATATGSPNDDVTDADAPAESTADAKAEPKTPRPGAKTAAKATTRTARPGVKTAAARTPAARTPAARPPVKSGGGKGRKPTKVVKVSQGRNWGPIAMFAGAGALALLIIGFGAFQVIKKANQPSWQDRAAGIEGIQNYKVSNPDWFKIPAEGNHKAGVLQYPTSPPVGGIHNPSWQSCMGDVYTSEIAKEQATHSLEHGAVWIAYNPSLPKDQVDELASKVDGKAFMLMSPYPGLDQPISLQAWGYQLKLGDAGDKRIDQFIDALRQNATQEPQAGCSGGITDATKTPLDMAPLPTADPGAGAGAGG